ncbi:hypothetical protein [Mycolicibacterium wolinskyi]|uniref:hypothetical protein n=1 Tax=Mycolicibacterium wolinskyi TaxID=59750 RepID=UPI00391788E5
MPTAPAFTTHDVDPDMQFAAERQAIYLRFDPTLIGSLLSVGRSNEQVMLDEDEKHASCRGGWVVLLQRLGRRLPGQDFLHRAN